MKKIIFLLFAVAFFTSACNKISDNYLFDQSPDERINAILSEYSDVLTGASDGWLMWCDTKKDGGYSYWCSFNDKDRVKMLSNWDATKGGQGATSTVEKESSYRLKHMLKPSLIFDTYSYIHLTSDPATSVNGGAVGSGLGSDFEFNIDSLSADKSTFYLTGRFNKTAVVMRKVSSAEGTAIASGALTTNTKKTTDFFENLSFPSLSHGGKIIEVAFINRQFSMQYYDAQTDQIDSKSVTAFADIPASGYGDIVLFEPLDLFGFTVSRIYGDGTGYYIMLDGTKLYVADNGTSTVPLNFGYNKTYKRFVFTPSLAKEPFQSIITGLQATVRPLTLTLSSTAAPYGCIALEFMTEKYARMSVTFNTGTATNYTAYAGLWYVENPDGTITFTNRASEDAYNTNIRGLEVGANGTTPLFDFFCTNTYSPAPSSQAWPLNQYRITSVTPHTFKLAWIKGKVGTHIGLYRVDAPENYIPGAVGTTVASVPAVRFSSGTSSTGLCVVMYISERLMGSSAFSQSAKAAYDSAVAGLVAAGKSLDYYTLTYTNATTLTLGLKYGSLWARWDYTIQGDKLISRDQSSTDTNNREIEPIVKDFLDIFCKVEYSGYSASNDWATNKALITDIYPGTFSVGTSKIGNPPSTIVIPFNTNVNGTAYSFDGVPTR